VTAFKHEMSVEDALPHIQQGTLPGGTFVRGHLDLSNEDGLTELPAGLAGCWSLNLSSNTALEKLPDNMVVNWLNLSGCTGLKTLPRGLRCFDLQLQQTVIALLPDDVQVDYKLDLTDNTHIRELPTGLQVGSLVVAGCRALKALPDGLDVYFLDASNCMWLEAWGETGKIQVGHVNLSGCVRLTYLPEWIGTISQLDISGCEALETLPDALKVTSEIELANSGLQGLPEGAKGARLRWRDVQIDERVAFSSDTINAQEIFETTNVELRRVMIERIGYDEFFRQAEAEELDRDMDKGGIRRLLKVEFDDSSNLRGREEPIVVLSVIDPSTGRSYIIRVPPTTMTCRQAAAWIAGFDDPDQYNPIQET
jgi:hypothetical protein